MLSMFDELTERLLKDPRLTKRGGPRFDLSLLLFNARDALRELWSAAEQTLVNARSEGRPANAALEAAVEKLRPIFGARGPR